MFRSLLTPATAWRSAFWLASVALSWYAGSQGLGSGSPGSAQSGEMSPRTGAAPWAREGSSQGEDGRPKNSADGSPAADADAPGRSGDYQKRLKSVAAMPPGPERNEAWTKLIADWAKSDPEAALATARAMPELMLRHQLKETALHSWAESDPAAAWDYAARNPDGDLPDDRMEVILSGIGNGDPQKALDFLQSHQSKLGSMLGRAANLVDELYERGGNHDRLRTWVESLPAGSLRDASMNRFIDRWARYDPQSALAWMNSRNIPAAQLTAARVELTESWSRLDPKAALAWTEQLPAKERDPAYYEAIYRRWLQYDRNDAAGWLANQPPSPLLDRPIENYVRQVTSQNPADTMPWAESITDPKRRWRAVDQVADSWRKRDQAAFENYVRASGAISDAQKRRLLRLDEKKTVEK